MVYVNVADLISCTLKRCLNEYVHIHFGKILSVEYSRGTMDPLDSRNRYWFRGYGTVHDTLLVAPYISVAHSLSFASLRSLVAHAVRQGVAEVHYT